MTNCTKIHSFVTCLFPFGSPQNNWKSNPALGNKKKKCCVPSIWPKDLDISTRQSDRVTTSRKHPFMDAAAHGKCPQASGPPLFRSQTDKLQGMLVIFHVKCLQMLNLTGCGELRNITQFLKELAFTHIESCRLALVESKEKYQHSMDIMSQPSAETLCRSRGTYADGFSDQAALRRTKNCREENGSVTQLVDRSITPNN